MDRVIVVWFKRDLRVTDHAALLAASKTKYPVVPLYSVETDYWQQPLPQEDTGTLFMIVYDSELCCTHLGQRLIVRQSETLLPQCAR